MSDTLKFISNSLKPIK